MNTDYTEEEIAELAALLETESQHIEKVLSPDLSWVTELEEASTFGKANRMWSEAPEGSDIERAALSRMIELASTFDEAEQAYGNTPHKSDAERAALMRMIELASTLEEAQSVYAKTSAGDEAKRAALVKMLEMNRAKKAERPETV